MGRFFAVVNDPEYAPIDTLNTFLYWLGGTRLSNVLFRVSQSPVLGVLSLGGTMCGYAGFVGVPFPYAIGFGTLALMPAILLAIAFSNVYLACCLTRTFTFWLVLGFNTAFVVCGADMVRFDPARVCALVCYWWSNVALVLFDARLFGKRRSNMARQTTMTVFACNAIGGVVCGFLYVFGKLDVRYTILPLPGEVDFPVSGAGMSLLQALVTYQLKCVWALWVSRDVNPLLILHAKIAYFPVGAGAGPEEEPDVSSASPESGGGGRRVVHSMRVTETPMPETLDAAHREIAQLRIQVYALRMLAPRTPPDV